jgi:hypothetical protein
MPSFVVRLRCQRHAGAPVRIGVMDTYFREAEEFTAAYLMTSDLMWCEGRESGPDPVEDPDCSDSWTISMARERSNDAGY